MWGPQDRPIMINWDNQRAIALVKDKKFHSHMKHIDLWYHFICEAVECDKIKLIYIPTDKNVSDLLTKGLARPKFERFVEMLGLRELKEETIETQSRKWTWFLLFNRAPDNKDTCFSSRGDDASTIKHYGINSCTQEGVLNIYEYISLFLISLSSLIIYLIWNFYYFITYILESQIFCTSLNFSLQVEMWVYTIVFHYSS